MSRRKTELARGFGLLFLLPAACAALAEPVARDTAFLVASCQLPAFYPGPWQLSDEYRLENLAGGTVAYTFIFRKKDAKPGEAVAPTSFVQRARSRLKGEGVPATENAPELYGEALFASIVISADDTEPPLLRCFQGLPPHVVKEEAALALVAKKRGPAAWRVKHRLMLGMFDEAFCLENAEDAAAAQVVDMRTGTLLTKAEAELRVRARRQTSPGDAERVRMCRAAWQEAVAQSAKCAAPGQPAPAGMKLKGPHADPPSLPLRRNAVPTD